MEAQGEAHKCDKVLLDSIRAMTGKMQTIEDVLKILTKERSGESVHIPEQTINDRAENGGGVVLEHDLALIDEEAVWEAKKAEVSQTVAKNSIGIKVCDANAQRS